MLLNRMLSDIMVQLPLPLQSPVIKMYSFGNFAELADLRKRIGQRIRRTKHKFGKWIHLPWLRVLDDLDDGIKNMSFWSSLCFFLLSEPEWLFRIQFCRHV